MQHESMRSSTVETTVMLPGSAHSSGIDAQPPTDGPQQMLPGPQGKYNRLLSTRQTGRPFSPRPSNSTNSYGTPGNRRALPLRSLSANTVVGDRSRDMLDPPDLPPVRRRSDIASGSNRFQELLCELSQEHEEAIRSLNKELSLARGSSTPMPRGSYVPMPPVNNSPTHGDNEYREAEPAKPKQLPRTLSDFSNCDADVTQFEKDEQLTRQVEVTVFSGHNLKNADIGWLGNKSDPYCLVHWQSDAHGRWRTPVIPNNLNPVWNHIIDIGPCKFDEVLEFTVWDEDHFKKDDLLGRASLPAFAFCTTGFEGKLPLKDEKGKNYGELHVKIEIHEPQRLAKLRHDCHEDGRLSLNSISETAHLTSLWHWETLVRMTLDSVECDMRWPRPVWRRMATVSSRFLVKQATQRLTEVVEMARSQHENSVSPRDVRRAGTFMTVMEIPMAMSNWRAMDPHSKKRLSWAFIGLLFMLYDVIMIPMQVFVLPENTVFDVVTWTSQIYWTLDIVMTFFTGVYINSQLHTHLWKVGKRYLSTWFLFDIVVTIPTYVPLVAQNSSLAQQATVTQSMRTVRIFRLMRLVRLCKFESMLNDTLEVINSPGLLLTIRMFKHNVALIIWNHIIACIWFFIGDLGSGWIVEMDVAGEDFSYRYLTSLHWTLTQYQGNSEIVPTTAAERAYAVFFLQFAMIILALFVSRLTNMMRQMQELMHERSAQSRAVCVYLAQNAISTSLSVRVKKYVEWQRRFAKRRKEDEEVLLILPTPILMDLLEEVRGPVLKEHPFFQVFCQDFSRTSRRICHEAVGELTPAPGETVFALGDTCSEMYFVRSGQLRYVAKPRTAICKVQRNYRQNVDQLDPLHDLGNGFEKCNVGGRHHSVAAFVENAERVNQGFWLSEAVLWCDWEHCGDLTGLEDNILLTLHHEHFEHIVSSQQTAAMTASLYARRFVAAFDRFGTTFTDLIDHNTLFQEEDDTLDNEDNFSRGVVSLVSNKSFLSSQPGLPSLGSAARAVKHKMSSLFAHRRFNGVSHLHPASHLHPVVSTTLPAQNNNPENSTNFYSMRGDAHAKPPGLPMQRISSVSVGECSTQLNSPKHE